MCLDLSRFAIPKIALKDIVVYKFIEQRKEGHYITPYREHPVEIGKTYKSKIDIEGGIGCKYRWLNRGLHSFKNLSKLEQYVGGNNVAVKCIIPAGAIYYKGTFDGSISYASNKLKYVEIINTDEIK